MIFLVIYCMFRYSYNKIFFVKNDQKCWWLLAVTGNYFIF